MWRRLVFSIDSELEQALSECLEQAGAISIILEPDSGEALLEPDPGAQPLWKKLRLTGLFEPEIAPDQVLAQVRSSLGEPIAAGCVITRLDDRDWESAWLEDIEPLCFADRLWVLPSQMALPSQATGRTQTVLRLDPGLAFGSGRHPTTQLCLGFLAVRPLVGSSVIDFGCGSGILAIAAALLGAERVLAIDHDPQAIIACNENAKLNNCGASIKAVLSEPLQLAGLSVCNLLLANILANPLMALAPLFSRLVKSGGEIALSGILEDQVSMVAGAYVRWFEIHQGAAQEGWVRLDGVRRQ